MGEKRLHLQVIKTTWATSWVLSGFQLYERVRDIYVTDIFNLFYDSRQPAIMNEGSIWLDCSSEAHAPASSPIGTGGWVSFLLARGN